ncbi:MAG: ABC transporter permease, partial [Nitriliruptoraceae bacterium]
GGVPAVDFLVPGALAIAVVATGMVAVPIQTAFERKYGVLKRLGSTPLPAAGFLAAKALAVAALVAVQSLLVLALAIGVLGWRPEGGAAVVPLGIAVGAVAATSLGLLIAGALRAETTLALTNALFLVLLMISGVAFDVAVLPASVAGIGQLLPLGALVRVLRTGLDGGGFDAVAFGVLGVTAVAAIAAASRWFRWEP